MTTGAIIVKDDRTARPAGRGEQALDMLQAMNSESRPTASPAGRGG